jgi:hypothetical protein
MQSRGQGAHPRASDYTEALQVCVFSRISPRVLIPPRCTVSQANSSPQPSRATRGGWAAVLRCGEAFFLRMTARLCTLGRKRTHGTPSHRASAPAQRWRFAAVRCPAVLHPPAAPPPPPPPPPTTSLPAARSQGCSHIGFIRWRVSRCNRGPQPRPAENDVS